MSDRIFNFSAGPGVLPESVLKQVQKDVWNIAGSGIGIMEHSHRGKVFDAVLAQCEADIREIGSIPANYRVMFCFGGASTHFALVPMNFLRQGQTADYFLTGEWAKKAAADAKAFGTVNICASSQDRNFCYIPPESKTTYTPGAAYCHFTSNNTIFGTQHRAEPKHPAGVPLVCDASSDIFSKPIDVTKYALLYCGAQKNLGPSGVVLVIARDDFIEKGREDLPLMLQYRTQAKNESRYNTPNTFGIYTMGQVMKWIKAQGGLKAMAQINEHKAGLLYSYLDESKFFKGTADRDSRSLMNICFRCPTEELEAKFVKEATAAGFDGLKGHRSVGGMRASIYNAFPTEGVVKLVEFMKKFEQANR